MVLGSIVDEWQKDYNYKQIAPLRIHELREGINIKVLSCPFFPVFLHSLADKTKVRPEGTNLNRSFRYQIKAFGYDKNGIRKNLTG